MSCAELISEIERLRSKMNGMAHSGASYAKVLEVSQQLDRLIVLYHRTTAQ